MSIADLRREYSRMGLHERTLDPNPFRQFATWFEQALSAEILDANAMTLATASREGKPSARIMLLKGFDDLGFVFFSNYESRKGQELAENPYAALVFFWAELERQVRITGKISRISRQDTEEYFQNRPPGSQLGALVSRQSQVINSPEELESRLQALETQYQGKTVPVPAYWGGYLLSPDTFEFWQGRPNRLHDRLRYTLQPAGSWLIERLSP
ncbi:MAG: pyridoxamine 5'-phosphate oxidase [Terriglobia bacterium]